jgi:hypothetical protein
LRGRQRLMIAHRDLFSFSASASGRASNLLFWVSSAPRYD